MTSLRETTSSLLPGAERDLAARPDAHVLCRVVTMRMLLGEEMPDARQQLEQLPSPVGKEPHARFRMRDALSVACIELLTGGDPRVACERAFDLALQLLGGGDDDRRSALSNLLVAGQLLGREKEAREYWWRRVSESPGADNDLDFELLGATFASGPENIPEERIFQLAGAARSATFRYPLDSPAPYVLALQSVHADARVALRGIIQRIDPLMYKDGKLRLRSKSLGTILRKRGEVYKAEATAQVTGEGSIFIPVERIEPLTSGLWETIKGSVRPRLRDAGLELTAHLHLEQGVTLPDEQRSRFERRLRLAALQLVGGREQALEKVELEVKTV